MSTHPNRSAYVKPPWRFVIRDVPLADPGAGELLVEIGACALFICGQRVLRGVGELQHVRRRSDLVEDVAGALDELHAQGSTVVLVTHNEPLARRAERLVTLRDGRIESEGRP